MDLLGHYNDSDDEGQELESDAVASGPPVAKSQPRNPAPEPEDSKPQAAPAALFNPFAPAAEGDRAASHASASPSGGGKRGFTQVTGSGPLQDAPPKAPRNTTSPGGPKPAFNTALVPPQLRNGRANVSTEDVEKIFTKGALSKRQPKG